MMPFLLGLLCLVLTLVFLFTVSYLGEKKTAWRIVTNLRGQYAIQERNGLGFWCAASTITHSYKEKWQDHFWYDDYQKCEAEMEAIKTAYQKSQKGIIVFKED